MTYSKTITATSISELEKLVSHLKAIKYPPASKMIWGPPMIMSGWTSTLKLNTDVCQTVGCIAGEYAIMRQAFSHDGSRFFFCSRFHFDFEAYFAKHTELDCSQVGVLLYLRSWPNEFRKRYAFAHSLPQQRNVMVARLRHFLRTGI